MLLKAKNKSLYEKALSQVKEQALSTLPYYPNRIRIREFESNLTFFCQFEISDSAGFEKHYVSTQSSHTFAFDGLPYNLALKPQKNWAEQFDRQWQNDDKAISEIYGTWAFARFDSQKGGRVLTDFTGMTPLFYWQDKNYLAISPRQMLLSSVCGHREIDIEALAWLSGQANIIGDKSPWKQVCHLPPQWTMRFSAKAGDLDFNVIERKIWTSDIDESFSESDVTVAVEAILDQSQALAKIGLPSLNLDITGGLDSRLVAVLANATLLRSNVGYLSTHGQENSHEIQVGRSVANSLGFSHRANVLTAQQFSPEMVLDLIRYHGFHHESSICAADGLSGAAVTSRMIFTGAAGEIYRRHCKPHMNIHLNNKDELWELYGNYHQITDPLSIELPDLREKQQQAMRQLAMNYHEQGAELNDISDIFFMRYRLPLWNGVLLNNIYGGVRVYPLANYKVAKLAFSKGYKSRLKNRIHFELLLKINPELCASPFLGFVWPKELQKIATKKGINLADKPFPVTGKPSIAQISPVISAFLSDEGFKLARSYLFDSPHSPVFNILDKKAVDNILATGAKGIKGITQAKQLLAILGIHATLTDDLDYQYEGVNTKPIYDGFSAQKLLKS